MSIIDNLHSFITFRWTLYTLLQYNKITIEYAIFSLR